METLRIAVEALRAHKLRSVLTLLGVIIGVMTVVVVVSITAGLNRFVAERLFQLSPDVFIVSQFGIITSREEFLEALRRKPIELADLEAIERLCTGCGDVGASVQAELPARRGGERLAGVTVFGSTANMAELNNLDLEAGRFFAVQEEERSATVAVIGWELRDQLFGRVDPVGRKVWVAGNPLEVVGALRKQGSILGQSQDRQLYMPLGTFRKLFGGERTLNVFARPAGGMAALEAAQDEVRTILRSRRHTRFRDPDPFGMVTAAGAQNVWRGISAGAFALMFFISGISLVVGGIVIMNIMLVSVVERTREIGVRRAAGARRRDILLQFLTESALLGLAGGLVGVGLGAALSAAVGAVSPLPTLVRPGLVAAGLALAVLTGVLAGVVPARKAALLPPVEALGHE